MLIGVEMKIKEVANSARGGRTGVKGKSPVSVSGTSGGPGGSLSRAEPVDSSPARRGVIQALIESGSDQICG